MSAPALRLDAVGFAYRQAPVFRDLTLEIAPGEITAVLGPNGSGKSTLVRLACGALTPRTGRVSLFGRNLTGLPPRERARLVAVVPQESHLVFDFTVREVVLMGRAPRLGLLGIETDDDARAAREALERTEIAHLEHRPYRTLSGGERQRVILARALAQEPRLLLLDEPTAFLDLKHRLMVYELLTQLNREAGLTVLAVSHDLNLAARYCRRLVLLRCGTVEADGTPDEVLRPDPLRLVYEVEVEVRHDPLTERPYTLPRAPVRRP